MESSIGADVKIFAGCSKRPDFSPARPTDQYAVLAGPNGSHRDFPHAAEAIHRKKYPLPADTCQRGKIFHRLCPFPPQE